AAGPSGGRAVVDPACGLGTLLLAAARAWKGEPPRLVGRDISTRGRSRGARPTSPPAGPTPPRCSTGTRGSRAWPRLRSSTLGDGEAEAVLCDLPCGDAHRRGADQASYGGFLREAGRVLRPGGRCVLLSTRRDLLEAAVAEGPWQRLVAWRVARDERNAPQAWLLALERL
ncbi:unnamed protein product, partial [Prorocentrum cordatum]